MEANKKKKYVIVLECSAGNDQVGDMWLETFICKSETTIEEIMRWKKETRSFGKGRLMITEASELKVKKDEPF